MANSFKIGSPIQQLEKFRYETPQGENIQIPKKTSLIIIAFEKDTGAMINKYLSMQNSSYLVKKHIVFIADIHSIPSLFIKLFALPKLRKFKHKVYLHYGNKFEIFMPSKEGKITLIKIQSNKVKSISYVQTIKELEESIEK